jgi:SagB-type dehydrogenase family enzyme
MSDICKDFLRASRLPLTHESDQSRGVPQPPLTLPPDPAWPLIDLPAPAAIQMPPCDLRAAIETRRTLRRYAGTPLILTELSYLLWCTQGVKEVTARPATLRTVPSAGARHAFETYVLANRVDPLAPGLYYFAAREHRLAAANPDAGIAHAIHAASLQQDHVLDCAAMFIWAAVPARMTWRYSERGCRYLFLDAGHVCQNLALVAESLGCGICPIGAFEDEPLNAALGLDGEQQFVIYAATLGKKP